MDDGPPPQEEDFSQLPINDRLAHKNWKARVSGYEALIKTFEATASDNDPAFKPYLHNPDLLKKIVTDSNAVAQERGVECVVAFVKFAGESAARTRETVVPALVDKCFGSSRAGTKNQAIELALQYVEVDNGGAGVVNDVLVGLGAKQPKAVAGSVVALHSIVRLFDVTTTPPAPILKALPKIFGHTDKTVRAEGTTLAHNLYQYLGPGIDPWLADLKPVQTKELKEAFEKMEQEGRGKGSLKPERMTREQAREADMRGAAADGDGVPEDEPEEVVPPDPRMLAEPVDIIPKLSSSFQTSLTSSKWKERKEALDDLVTLLNSTPRVMDAPGMGELAKSLAVRIHSDANINCVMVAANAMEALAKGVMNPFGKYREAVVGLMLERMKERKASVTDTIGAALDAVFTTTTLPDVVPDILPALGSKNPQVKEGTLKFLGRCLSTSTTPIPSGQIKTLCDPLAALLEDSFEGARNEAAVCLGTLMKMVGERPLNALMSGLADVRKAKVIEAYEKATVKSKTGAGGPPPKPAPAPAPNKAPSAVKAPAPKATAPPEDVLEEPHKKPVAKASARLMSKKPPAGTASGGVPPASSGAVAAPAKMPPPAASAPSKATKGGAAPAPSTLDVVKYKHTSEDAEALAAELFPASILKDFGDSNWKTRLAALDEMTIWAEGAVDSMDAEVAVRALVKRGSSEKNFQVSAKLYAIFCLLAQRCPTFGRSSVALATPHLSEKLGDMKLKKPAGEALVAFAEATSLQLVLNQAYEPLSKQKAPKVLADAIGWIDATVAEFGIVGVSLRSLIEFLKGALKNSNAAVRTSATKALVTVKLFAGSSIKDLLEDLNPQLMATISSEFDKVEGNPAPEPTRFSKEVAASSTSQAAASGKGAAGGDPLDDLFPRVEIDGLLKGTAILADAKSDAWKTKKEALEALQAILDQGPNKRLKPQMGEIGQVLKARVTDTNKAVQSLALDIVSRIATGMGKPFEKQTRFFTLPVCTVLADQKAPIRAAAVSTLTVMATVCEGLESMVHGLSTALETSNPVQKATLLNWLVEWFKEHEPAATLDLSSWSSSVVGSLDDRSGDVRKGALGILPALIACAGFDHVLHQTNSLKPASRKTAVPLIEAARGSASASKPSAPAPAPAGKAPAKVETRAPPPSVSPPPKAATPTEPATKMAVPGKLGVRRKLPQGTMSRPESRTSQAEEVQPPRGRTKPAAGGLKQPGASIASHPAPPAAFASSKPLPFSGHSVEAKKARLGKDVSRWINEAGTTRKDLADALQHQMEPHMSKDIVDLLFSHDHSAVNDHVSGLTVMCDFYECASAGEDTYGLGPEEIRAIALANFDLPLKYVSIKCHEPQSNVVSKCLDLVDAVVAFLRSVNHQLNDMEATCFIPTIVYKLGDAREPVRNRVHQIVQSLPKVYAYSRVFAILLEHGLKSKVAKTRQGALTEMGKILGRSGISACDPAKAFPQIASTLADKDPQVRKAALTTLGEAYGLVGDKIWPLVGSLSAKDKTQLEERLRRVPGPGGSDASEVAAPLSQVSRLAGPNRPFSPSPSTRIGGIPRAASPSLAPISKLARPASPAKISRAASPTTGAQPLSPVRKGALPGPSAASSPSGIARPKSMLPGPSRLTAPRTKISHLSTGPEASTRASGIPPRIPAPHLRSAVTQSPPLETVQDSQQADDEHPETPDDITITISSILSNDATRSVDALKKVQKVLALSPEEGPSSPLYRDLAEHTEGLIETITLQMAHVFEKPDELVLDENWRLAKHLIQTLNTFCDHGFLAESLTVNILTSLLEELTLRLLETDDSPVKKVKELSRFINMIILRLFAKGRRMSIFRALFALLIQIVKPFPGNGTLAHSREAKMAELVLKCVWKLARNIPDDLSKQALDPVELFPAIEHFLQSVPPNEWRARATNKVPCGDMPLRTIKVIIQHVVAHYGDEVYDLLSSSFDDPSATIVYPYVYRILNANPKAAMEKVDTHTAAVFHDDTRPVSSASSRPISPQSSTADHRRYSPSHRTTPSTSSQNGNGVYSPNAEEPDPDAQLLTIIGHISSETTGALHKEGITELHHFLKAYPHKKPRVEKMLESTGAAFRKYINRALASRAAEDQERDVAVADTLSRLESNKRNSIPTSPPPARLEASPRSPRVSESAETQDKLSRLHDIFQYRSSATSNGSSQLPLRPSHAPNTGTFPS